MGWNIPVVKDTAFNRARSEEDKASYCLDPRHHSIGFRLLAFSDWVKDTKDRGLTSFACKQDRSSKLDSTCPDKFTRLKWTWVLLSGCDFQEQNDEPVRTHYISAPSVKSTPHVNSGKF